MIGHIDKRIIDGKVYVDFDALVAGIYDVAKASVDIAEITGDTILATQALGIIELGNALDTAITEIKKKNGLAMYR